MNASVTEGPDLSAIAAAVRTNRPAPMMAPIPSAIRDMGPSVRFSVCAPPSDSARSLSTDFVAKRLIVQLSFQMGSCGRLFSPDKIDWHTQQDNPQPRPSVVRFVQQ